MVRLHWVGIDWERVMRKTRIRPNETKFRELILYLAQQCREDDTFGAVKLNKLLFHADFLAYGMFGEPMTGMEYMKLENGPAPRALLPMREEMLHDQEITIEKRDYFDMPRPQERIIAQREPNLSHFTPQEISLVDRIIRDFWGMTATQITEMTHRYRGWRMARNLGDTIPYSAVFLSDEAPTQYELQHAEELIREHEWNV
jgi:hypothetical protein